MWRFEPKLTDSLFERETVTYLVYLINEGLGIISGEVHNRPDLITVREYHRDQGDALVLGEGISDQPFPCWAVTAHKKTVRPRNV